jgi:glycosyltransferase involved in cell wall biosynthesis
MPQQPLISVITAAYNAQEGIQHCINSVAEQTHDSIEHILVDGASNDETNSILKSNQSPKIKWISEPDSGIAEAMNKGIKMATGEWLFFLHADDKLMSPDSLQNAASYLPNTPAIASFRVELTSNNQTSHIIENLGWCLKTNFKTSLGHQGALIHRDLFKQLGNYDESFEIAMDYDWFLRAMREQTPIYCHDQILASMQDTGISSRKDWRSLTHRFNEEKRVHFKNAPTAAWRAAYSTYWILYPLYRKIRYILPPR